ncbi:MAG: hypothetical protein QM820_01785 [Minicystis sp.]
MNRVTRLEFGLLAGGAWRPLDEVTGRAPELVSSWLAEDRLSCCSFQGGFFIDIDGEPWSDDGTVDEYWMTVSWFAALAALLGGEETFGPTSGPWEESQLVWRREGDDVVMEDIHHSGSVAMKKVRVPLRPLAERVAAEGRRFLTLAVAIGAEVVRRRVAGEGDGEKLDEIERNLVEVAPQMAEGIEAIERALAHSRAG